MVRLFFIFNSILFFVGTAMAAPGTFSYQGQIVKPNGQALEAANVTFTIEVLSPAPSECVLYKEQHVISMSGSNGIFALEVGTGSRAGGPDYEDLVVNDLSKAISNSEPTMTPTNCVVGPNYTPSQADGRQLRVTFDDGTGPNTLATNHQLVSVPFADSASSIDGLLAADILQLRTDSGYVLDQANLEWIFETNARYVELQDLISGTSSQYISSAPSATVSMNGQVLSNVAAPVSGTDAVNMDYADQNIGGAAADSATISVLGAGESGRVMVWDGTQWTAQLPAGDSTKLPLAGGTMTGAINMGNQDITNANNIAANGSVSANGLSTGTNLALYNGANYMGFQAPGGAADLIWTLPGADGAANQALSTDGAGVLSWRSYAESASNVGAAGEGLFKQNNAGDLEFKNLNVGSAKVTLTDDAGNDEIDIDVDESQFDLGTIPNTAAGNIAATDAQAAIDELDNEKVAIAGDAMTGALTMNAQNEVRFADSDSSNYVGFASPAVVAADMVWTLPDADGANLEVLQTDGAGNLSFVALPTAPVTDVFGRTGNVIAAASDYDAVQVDNTPAGNIAATDVQGAIDELDTEKVDSARAVNTAAGSGLQGGGDLSADRSLSLDVPNIADLGAAVDNADTLIVYDASGTAIAEATRSELVLSEAEVDAYANNNGYAADADKVDRAGDTMTGNLNMDAESEVQFADSVGGEYAAIKAPNDLVGNYVLTLPADDGAANEVLETDGAGNLSWVAIAAAPVTDVFGRTGNVIAAASDYDANQVDNTPAGNIAATDVQGAIDELDTEKVDSARAVNTVADSGLAGGGDLSADRSLNVDIAGTTDLGAAVDNADSVLVYDASGTVLREATRSELVLSEAEVDAYANNNGYAADADKVDRAGDAMTGALTMNAQNEVRFADSDSSNYVGFASPAVVAADMVWVLPDADGGANEVLETDGAGNLSWVAIPSAPVASVHGRTGIVVSAASDYDAVEVDNTPAGNITATDVQGAIDELDTEKVDSGRALTAGAGLTGGGDLSADRTFDVGAGDGIAVAADSVAVDIPSVTDFAATVAAGDTILMYDADATAMLEIQRSAFVLSETEVDAYANNNGYAPEARNINTAADSGLTGGGDLSADRSLSVDIPGTTDLGAAVAAADTILIYDASGTALREATRSELVLSEAEVDAYADNNGYIEDGGNLTGANVVIGTNDAFELQFETNGANRMIIDNAGNVGIAQASPNSRFEVGGDIQIGNDSVACGASKAGAMRYNGGAVEFCDGGGTWQAFGTAAGGEVNDGTNVGAGAGQLYAGKTGTDIEFKSIAAGSTKLSITNNATDVTLDVAEANLNTSNIPNTAAGNIAATDTQAAIDELDTEKLAIDFPSYADLGAAADNADTLMMYDTSATALREVTRAEIVLSEAEVDAYVGNNSYGDITGALNIGTGGEDIFLNENAGVLEFATINDDGNGKITVTTDAINDEIDLTVNESNLDPTAIPNTAAGNIAATNVQGAINELDTEKIDSGRAINTAAGSGLQGGGDLSADRSLSLDVPSIANLGAAVDNADTLIVYDASGTAIAEATRAELVLSEAEVDAYANNNGYAAESRNINTNADSGLSGGGDLSADRTLTVDIPGTTDLGAAVAAADTILIYDASGTALREATRTELVLTEAEVDAYANNNGYGDILDGGNTNTANVVIGTNDAFELQFETAGTNRMIIDNAGNVGINQASPNSIFEVGGDIQIGNSVVACGASKAGAMRYNGGAVEFCDGGGTWVAFGTAAGGEVNDGTNVGAGAGQLYAGKTGNDIEFKSIAAGSTKLSITNNANDVTLDVAEANLNTSNIPNTAAGNIAATNTQAAIDELDTEKLSNDFPGFTDLGAAADNADTLVLYDSSATSLREVTRSELVLSEAEVDSMVSNNNFVADSRAINTAAGSGLQGGGDLSADRSLSLDIPSIADLGAAVDNADTLIVYDSSGTAIAEATRAELVLSETEVDAYANNNGYVLADGTVNMTGSLLFENEAAIQLEDTTNGNNVSIKAPEPLAASYTLTLPADDGTSGQVLQTNGSGVLTWAANGVGDVTGGSSLGSGVAVYRNETGGGVLEFASVNTGSEGIVISNDVINDEIDIELNITDVTDFADTVAATDTILMYDASATTMLEIQRSAFVLSESEVDTFVGNNGYALAARNINTNADSGLSGGGDLSADRTLTVDIPGTTDLGAAVDAADTILIYDASGTALREATRTELVLTEAEVDAYANNNGYGDILDGGNTNTANVVIGTNDAFELQFATSGANRMIIDSSGNVGINQASPNSIFEVGGDIQIGNSVVACGASKAGAMRYNGGAVEFCDGGGTWVAFGTASGGEVNDGTNVGAGTGQLYAGKTGNNIEFKSIAAGSTKLSITNNANDVTLDVAEANLSTSNIPNTAAGNIVATNTQAAINELDSEKLAIDFPSYTDLGATAANNDSLIIYDSSATALRELNRSELVLSEAEVDAYANNNGYVLADGTVNMTGSLLFENESELRLEDTTNGNYVAFKSPEPLAASYTLTMPADDGGANEFLQTDGSGNLTWASPAGITADSLDFTDFSDTMSLDASTDIAVTGTNELSITNTGTGDSFIVNDSAGDTSPFVIDASGNVGVGTTTPADLLHIHKNQDNYTSVRISNESSGTVASTNLGFYNDTGSIGGLLTSSSAHIVPHLRDRMTLVTNGTNGTGINLMASGASSDVRIYTGGTTASEERIRVTASGDVGVGTTAPEQKLDVEGSILSGPKGVAAGDGGAIRFEELVANIGAGAVEYVGFRAPDSIADGDEVIWELPAADGTSGQFLQTDGSGVLTWASPAGITADSLDFTDFSDTMSLDASTDIAVTGTNELSITNTGTGDSFIVNDSAGDTSPFVIDASGNVGIGTASPTNALHVYNSAPLFERTTASTTNSVQALVLQRTTTGDMVDDFGVAIRFQIEDDANIVNHLARVRAVRDGADNSGSLEFLTGTDGNSLAMNINSSGNVGIGTTTPGGKLDVEGSILSGPKGVAAGDGGAIRFEELVANIGAGAVEYVGFRAPDSIADGDEVIWELPAADGTSGQVLQTNGSGALSWVAQDGTGATSIDELSDATANDTNNNLAFGTGAGAAFSSGTKNIAIGQSAMNANDGDGNIAIGFQAMQTETNSFNVIAIGENATQNADGMSTVIAMGRDTLGNGDFVFNSVHVGDYTMIDGNNSYRNSTLGAYAMNNGTFAFDDVAVGFSAGFRTTTAARNVYVGSYAGYRNTTGNDNVIIGTNAALGSGSPNGAITGNVIIGKDAAFSIDPTSDGNVFVGYSVGSNVSTGSDNILIGNNVDLPTATTSNYISIGNTIRGTVGTDGDINFEDEIRLDNDANDNYVALKAPDGAVTSVTFTLPAADGTSGQVLSTNASGVLSWVDNGAGAGDFLADGSVAMTDALTISMNGDNNMIILDDTNGASNDDVSIKNNGINFMIDHVQTPKNILGFNLSSGNIKMGTNAAASANLTIHEASVNESDLRFTNSDTGETSSDGTRLGIDNNENAFINQEENLDFWIGTNNTERFRIDAAGNVGIGTNAPAGKLDVDGDIRMLGSTSGYAGFQAPAVAPDQLWTLPSADGTSGQVLQTNGSGVLTWADADSGIAADSIDFADISDAMTLDASTTINMDTNTADLNFDSNTLFIDSSANSVGIGTASPNSKFHVYHVPNADGQADIVLENANWGFDSGLRFKQGGFDKWHFGFSGDSTEDVHLRKDNGAEIQSWDYSSGNVGIGTNAPDDKLVVDGVIRNLAAVDQSSNTTFSFSTGNIQYTTDNCQTFDLHNMKSGGSYTFVVQGATSATCTFNAYSDAGTTALTVHMPADHGATTASKHTIYTAIVAGTHIYFAWVPDL